MRVHLHAKLQMLLQVMDFLGSAAFSKAVQALDTKTGMLVCLKIIKVVSTSLFRPVLLLWHAKSAFTP